MYASECGSVLPHLIGIAPFIDASLIHGLETPQATVEIVGRGGEILFFLRVVGKAVGEVETPSAR